MTRFEDRGACSTALQRVTVPSLASSCVRSGPVQLVTTPEALAPLLDCAGPDIDFRTHRALVVPVQQGGVDGFVLPNFVARGEGVFEVGVITKRLGAPPQSTLLLLPAGPERVRVVTCESVCVEGCDRAIP